MKGSLKGLSVGHKLDLLVRLKDLTWHTLYCKGGGRVIRCQTQGEVFI